MPDFSKDAQTKTILNLLNSTDFLDLVPEAQKHLIENITEVADVKNNLSKQTVGALWILSIRVNNFAQKQETNKLLYENLSNFYAFIMQQRLQEKKKFITSITSKKYSDLSQFQQKQYLSYFLLLKDEKNTEFINFFKKQTTTDMQKILNDICHLQNAYIVQIYNTCTEPTIRTELTSKIMSYKSLALIYIGQLKNDGKAIKKIQKELSMRIQEYNQRCKFLAFIELENNNLLKTINNSPHTNKIIEELNKSYREINTFINTDFSKTKFPDIILTKSNEVKQAIRNYYSTMQGLQSALQEKKHPFAQELNDFCNKHPIMELASNVTSKFTSKL